MHDNVGGINPFILIVYVLGRSTRGHGDATSRSVPTKKKNQNDCLRRVTKLQCSIDRCRPIDQPVGSFVTITTSSGARARVGRSVQQWRNDWLQIWVFGRSSKVAGELGSLVTSGGRLFRTAGAYWHRTHG